MGELVVTSHEVVERLRNEVAAKQADRFEPSLDPLPDVEPLTHDLERSYLNRHWAVPRTPALLPGGSGIKRRLKTRAAQFVMRVLEPHFEEEQQFRAHLVRLQNTLTVEHDRLSAEVRDVYENLRHELDRLGQLYAATHISLEDRVAALERRAAGAPSQGAHH